MMKTAKDIMTKIVHTVSPDTDVAELARLFAEKRVSGFPVVEGGRLVGIVTESDLIHQNERLHIPTTVAIFDAVVMIGSQKRVEEELQKMTARTAGEIMSRNPITIDLDTPVDEIATLMGDKGAHTLPVINDSGTIVGVVGKLDLIRAMAK